MASGKKGILSLRFNQDQGCFSCCMETGLRIYNVDPLVEKAHFDIELMGNIQKCEMLNRTNLLALIGGGFRERFPGHTVLIFDDFTKQFVSQYTFPTSVKSVRVRKDKLIVILLQQIHVFSFPPPSRLLFTVETRENTLGLCEMSPILTAERSLLVFPGRKIGSVQLLDLANTEANTSSAPVAINAHENELACLAINQQGTLIATASIRGTVIRVWDTTRKNLLNQFRRGSDQALLYCINFSQDSEYLCCSSDKGTIHIFAIKDPHLNRTNTLAKFGILGNYTVPKYALANFTVPPECACLCAFGSNKSSVIAICLDGTFHKYLFNATGICKREAYDIYLDVCEDDEY